MSPIQSLIRPFELNYLFRQMAGGVQALTLRQNVVYSAQPNINKNIEPAGPGRC